VYITRAPAVRITMHLDGGDSSLNVFHSICGSDSGLAAAAAAAESCRSPLDDEFMVYSFKVRLISTSLHV
jgi:hypothetical protein